MLWRWSCRKTASLSVITPSTFSFSDDQINGCCESVNSSRTNTKPDIKKTICLDNGAFKLNITKLVQHASVYQLIRQLGFQPRGCGFEPHHSLYKQVYINWLDSCLAKAKAGSSSLLTYSICRDSLVDRATQYLGQMRMRWFESNSLLQMSCQCNMVSTAQTRRPHWPVYV